jgi:hypothetical protein
MKSVESTDSSRIQFIQNYIADLEEDERKTEDDAKQTQRRLEDLRTERAEAEKVLLNLQRRAGILPPMSPEISDKSAMDVKGALFESFARQRGDQGFTIADIFKVFGDHNIQVGRNYAYFLVDMRYKTCLRKVGATRNGKRYYWIKNGTASE